MRARPPTPPPECARRIRGLGNARAEILLCERRERNRRTRKEPDNDSEKQMVLLPHNDEAGRADAILGAYRPRGGHVQRRPAPRAPAAAAQVENRLAMDVIPKRSDGSTLAADVTPKVSDRANKSRIAWRPTWSASDPHLPVAGLAGPRRPSGTGQRRAHRREKPRRMAAP